MKLNLLAKFLLAVTLALCQLDTQAASQAPVAAENGMVVTAQHLRIKGLMLR
jgi:gamma-glutamyltranspeptidase/glutathione hydrolase